MTGYLKGIKEPIRGHQLLRLWSEKGGGKGPRGGCQNMNLIMILSKPVLAELGLAKVTQVFTLGLPTGPFSSGVSFLHWQRKGEKQQ